MLSVLSPSLPFPQRFGIVLALIIALSVPLYLLKGNFDSQEIATAEAEMAALNVFKKPLALFSTKPMTGYYRDGYCRSGPADYGNHAVAGIVSEEFLDFSASQGNDLRVAGLSGGCKWCLCTSRWLEAYDAMKRGVISEKGVPKVELNATHESALNRVDLDTFKKFAVEEGSNS